MKKILTVVGARPQFIKIGPVSSKLAEQDQVEEFIVHTGQHFDKNMSDIFFEQLNLPAPNINLEIAGGRHGEQTAKMLCGIESIILEQSPDILLVYGDTNSTLAGALAAAKLHVPIAHIEAGLRSFNRQMPEEINRTLTDKLSKLLFTPSRIAQENLALEGVAPEGIFQVGDVMYDAVLNNIKHAREFSTILKDLSLHGRQYYLLTIHRAENTDYDCRLNRIVDEVIDVALNNTVIFPIHPRTRQALTRIGRLEEVSNSLQLVAPLGYLDNLNLVENAAALLTDSGGMQKEAMFLHTPCVTLRDETEWVETIEAGVNCLYKVGSTSLSEVAMRQREYNHNFTIQPYGDGHAAEEITQHLLSFLDQQQS